jgi:ubiquinone/menaquinone biosynthesis C-methylase UbiE
MSKEFWDIRYGQPVYAYGLQPNKYFKDVIDKLSPGKLFLPGEGEGRNAVYAARHGWEVNAVDLSSEAQKKAENLARENGVSITYRTGNLMDFTFQDNEFDLISLIFLHLPPTIRLEIHKQFIRNLKPGGYLLVEAFSKEQLGRPSGGPPSLELLYDQNILKEDFQMLEIKELYHTEETLNEGPYHQGEASLVRLLAQKQSSIYDRHTLNNH